MRPAQERPSRLRADASLLGVCAIWGFTFPAIQLALRDTGPVTFVCLRFGLATAALALLFRARAIRLQRAGLGYAALMGLCLAVGTVLQTLGLRLTTVPRSAFITALYVVLVPLMALAIERVRPRLSSVVAVLLALAGLYLLTEPRVSGFNLGDLLTLGCAFAFALHIVIVEMATAQHDAIALTFWQAAFAAMLSLLALPIMERPAFTFTPWTITALLVAGLLATALAFGIQMWAQRETSATHAAVILAAEPVFAALFAYMIQGTVMGPLAFVGAGLILGSMLVIQVGARR
jgi:drug/metabolite transporter (DMT)-like permease